MAKPTYKGREQGRAIPFPREDANVLPMFSTVPERGTMLHRNMMQILGEKPVTNIQQALAVPIISQAAADDFLSGNPYPETMAYLVPRYRKYGKGFTTMEEWLRSAVLKSEAYNPANTLKMY